MTFKSDNVMERFSLEKYLEDPSRKVVTKDGHEVRILCTDLCGRKPVVGAVRVGGDQEEVMTFTADGHYMYGEEGDANLFFTPNKQSRYVYLYKMHFKDGETKVYASYAYSNKEAAIKDMEECEGFAFTEITWEE